MTVDAADLAHRDLFEDARPAHAAAKQVGDIGTLRTNMIELQDDPVSDAAVDAATRA